MGHGEEVFAAADDAIGLAIARYAGDAVAQVPGDIRNGVDQGGVQGANAVKGLSAGWTIQRLASAKVSGAGDGIGALSGEVFKAWIG